MQPTVNSGIGSLLGKLDAGNRRHAVLVGLRHGFV
jgi:DNA-binding CsgD family transcriptional regulator